MSAIPLTKILPLGLLLHLLLFSFISLSNCVQFAEDNQGRISLRQSLGKQWAVGHFMGKKSLQDEDLEDSASFPQRSIESLRTAMLQEQRRAPSVRELQGAQRVLRKILEQYLKNTEN
ncbi:bombesin-like [Discoglossus pictus]